jgi:hypothetical protein
MESYVYYSVSAPIASASYDTVCAGSVSPDTGAEDPAQPIGSNQAVARERA